MKTKKEREQDAILFLRELMRDIPENERIIVVHAKDATIQVDENGKKINSGFWPKSYKEGYYLSNLANNYVCISSSIQTPDKNGKMRYWRGENSFGRGLCFFIDDIGSGKGSKGNLELQKIIDILPPTAIIETSPQNFQAYYFFDKPVNDKQLFKDFLYSFVENVLENTGGDITIKDISRVGRLPYGYNNKKNPDGSLKYGDEKGEPFIVHLVQANYMNRYDLNKISASFQFNITERVRRKARINDRDDLIFDKIWFEFAKQILNFHKLGEGTNGTLVENRSGKIRIRCPWGHEHSNGDPYGAYFRAYIDGADHDYVFGCAHDTCRSNKRTWATFVDEIVINYIEIKSLSIINQWLTGYCKDIDITSIESM